LQLYNLYEAVLMRYVQDSFIINEKENDKMSKITRKSINNLMNIYGQHNGNTVLKLTDPNNENAVVVDVELKTALTIPEKGAFVDRVVNACFDDSGDFMPQYLDPVFAITLLQMTTNVPVFENEFSDSNDENIRIVDIEKTYELCKAVNLVKNAQDINYQALVSELRQMVSEKVAYMKETNIRKRSSSLVVLKNVLDEIKAEIAADPDSFKEAVDLFKEVAIKMSDNVIPFPNAK